MNSVSGNFLRFGVLALIGGVCLGIWMGANEDFTLKPIHAHINLIGWATMMLYGLVYRAFPDAARGWAPVAHQALAFIGFLLMMPSLALLLLGNPVLLPALLTGEIMTLLSIVLFAVILFRATGKASAAASA